MAWPSSVLGRSIDEFIGTRFDRFFAHKIDEAAGLPHDGVFLLLQAEFGGDLVVDVQLFIMVDYQISAEFPWFRAGGLFRNRRGVVFLAGIENARL